MTVHILNSLTIRPFLTPVIGGVTCLLVETSQGPVLVDTGLGIGDHLHPVLRMRLYRFFYRASRGLSGTAYQLVQNFGYRPQDVRHILVSHLHLDHAGGLPDFPWAKVHVYCREYEHIMNRPNWKYLPADWAHGPDWVVHDLSGGKWFDFNAVQLGGFDPEIWMISLHGHTPGHVGFAIREGNALRPAQGDSWVLFGGDALPYNARVDLVPRWVARYFMYTHSPRIRLLAITHPEVRLVAGHMDLGFYENTLD